MFFTAAPLDAQKAKEWMLINHLVGAAELETVTYELAETMAAKSPMAMAVIKEQLRVLTDYQPIAAQVYQRCRGCAARPTTAAIIWIDLDGKEEGEIDLPALGTVGTLSGNPDSPELFYSFTSFLYPLTVYRYDLSNGQNTVFQKPNVNFDPDRYETKQIFYSSKDGTRIPMFIVGKKGLPLNGNNPVFLTGYGGFNISMTPSFAASSASWIEKRGRLCSTEFARRRRIRPRMARGGNEGTQTKCV